MREIFDIEEVKLKPDDFIFVYNDGFICPLRLLHYLWKRKLDSLDRYGKSLGSPRIYLVETEEEWLNIWEKRDEWFNRREMIRELSK